MARSADHFRGSVASLVIRGTLFLGILGAGAAEMASASNQGVSNTSRRPAAGCVQPVTLEQGNRLTSSLAFCDLNDLTPSMLVTPNAFITNVPTANLHRNKNLDKTTTIQNADGTDVQTTWRDYDLVTLDGQNTYHFYISTPQQSNNEDFMPGAMYNLRVKVVPQKDQQGNIVGDSFYSIGDPFLDANTIPTSNATSANQ